MFKEGILNYGEQDIPEENYHHDVVIRKNIQRRQEISLKKEVSKETLLGRFKRLTIIGSALTASLAGNFAEYKYIHSKYNGSDATESAERPIYISGDSPELLEDTEDQKPHFVETPVHREITHIENRLEEDAPFYGERSSLVERKVPKKSEYYKAPHITYKHKVNKPGFHDVKPFGRETIYGNASESWRIIEALKYKTLTSAVERRYNLPSNLIMAMMIQESGAKEFLPNESGDGGFGLSHMQGETAKRFGLNTICHSLVCNGSNRSCKDDNGENLNHGKQLREMIESERLKASRENYDFRETLSKQDERLNHLANIDAVGRMLARAIDNWMPNNGRTGIKEIDSDPLKTALCVYTGTVNFNKYWNNVCRYIKEIDDVDKLHKEWKKHQEGSTTLDTYLCDFQRFNAINYDVKEYVESLDCYTSNNSPAVFNTYKQILPTHTEKFFKRVQK